jgi:P-type conjugative transfer protein TrbJ
MIRKSWLAGAAACLALAAAAPAKAQLAVYDGANFAQSVLIAARELQQITNQITMLQNQMQMLTNQGKNLTNLNFSSISQINADLTQIEQLITKAQGLTFSVGHTTSQFNTLYPNGYPSGTGSSVLVPAAQARWTASLQALSTAVQVQSQISNSITADLATLDSKSGSAVGILQAVQTSNQLLELLIKQLMDEQTLKIAQDRATASEQSRGLSATASAAATRSQFSGSIQPYAPLSVSVFGSAAP